MAKIDILIDYLRRVGSVKIHYTEAAKIMGCAPNSASRALSTDPNFKRLGNGAKGMYCFVDVVTSDLANLPLIGNPRRLEKVKTQYKSGKKAWLNYNGVSKTTLYQNKQIKSLLRKEVMLCPYCNHEVRLIDKCEKNTPWKNKKVRSLIPKEIMFCPYCNHEVRL